VHDREDEFCYVLEGRIDAYVGKEVLPADPNEGVYFPKLVPHTFSILTPHLRMLILMSPGAAAEIARSAKGGGRGQTHCRLCSRTLAFHTSSSHPFIRTRLKFRKYRGTDAQGEAMLTYRGIMEEPS
jgi:hypothetical protein